METRSFNYLDGSGGFIVPLVVVQGYHYVKIKKEDILDQVPAVLASIQGGSKPNWVTFHWTAGSYEFPYKSYQINVNEGYILLALYATHYGYYGHTWKRNSGNLGISYNAMGGGKIGSMYAYDIRKKPGMIETGSLVLAAVMKHFGLKPYQITDHDAWSKKDGYDSYRWDNQLILSNGKTLFQTNLERALQIMSQEEKEPEVKPDQNHENVKDADHVCENETPFDDVCSKDWFADAVQFVADEGLMIGMKTKDGGHEFKPNKPLTRAEFSVALEKLYKKLMP